MSHLNNTRKQNPGMSLSQAMKKASRTYKRRRKQRGGQPPDEPTGVSKAEEAKIEKDAEEKPPVAVGAADNVAPPVDTANTGPVEPFRGGRRRRRGVGWRLPRRRRSRSRCPQ